MRVGWQPTWILIISLIAISASVGPVTAQGEVPVVQIEAGSQNPTGTVELTDRIQDLSGLQVVLTAETQPVSVDRIVVGFGRIDRDDTLGDTRFFDTLQARLIDDTNTNGVLDSGETVLGTQTLEELENPDTVMFTLSPALDLAVGVPTTLLTIIDINGPSGKSAQVVPSAFSRIHVGLLALPLLGLMLIGSGSQSDTFRLVRRYLPVLILISIWTVMLPGCAGSDDDDDFSFIVNLPSNGVTSQNVRLGPSDAISGITVRLIE